MITTSPPIIAASTTICSCTGARDSASPVGIQRLKTFLFDLGNVLLYFSHERMYAQIAALCGRTAADVRASLLEGDLGNEFERGRLSEAVLQQELGRRLHCRFEREALHHAVADIFEPNTELLAVVDRLRQWGFRLVLLSNTNSIHIRWIRSQFDVLDRFDACVLSHEVGALKPEPAAFEAALNVLNCAPGECFYTDDVAAYVEAGRTFGLQAEVFSGNAAFRRELARRSIELPAAG